MATLSGPSPFLWVSKVTLGTPAARLPRRFRHSRCWCLGLATLRRARAGLRAWRGQSGRAVSQSFLMGFEGDVRQSGREASEAFPSQLVFDTVSVVSDGATLLYALLYESQEKVAPEERSTWSWE